MSAGVCAVGDALSVRLSGVRCRVWTRRVRHPILMPTFVALLHHRRTIRFCSTRR